MKTVDEALELGIPLLGPTKFINLEQNSIRFTSSLTYIVDDFSNTFHRDKDKSSYAFGIWTPTYEQDGKLAKLTDDFHCEGGHFIIPSYKLYVDFGRCDGVVEIISRAKTNYHATSQSSRVEGFTHVGTSTQIPQSLVDRVKLLMQCPKNGEHVNSRIRGVKEIVQQKKLKLNK